MAKVKCAVCGKYLDYSKEQAVHSKNYKRRYCHIECEPDGEIVPLPAPKEKTDEEKILDYITNLYGKENVNYGSVKRQLANYRKQYNYTDSGMLKCLIYWYDVKKNNPDKANGGVGIIPYIYSQSYQYYYALWKAQQKNANKKINDYIPKEEIVNIPNPERPKIKKRKLFKFLDEESEE